MSSSVIVERLFETAADKYGSEEEVLALLPAPATSEELSKLSDDRLLSAATKCVFQAGFVWRVVEAKWPDFEIVFNGFNPLGMAHLSDERIEDLMQDERVIRHRQKLMTVRENGFFFHEVAQESGSFANLLANWPVDNIVGLWLLLKRRGSRLGGMTGPRFLRAVNKDTFLLTEDVCKALVNHGLIDTMPTGSKKTLQVIQSVFNELSDDCGLSLSQLSKLLAISK